MEIFSYHTGLNKWVEIGNSGIFRPEMLLPMGLPDDVVVIAWGLSLERFVFTRIMRLPPITLPVVLLLLISLHEIVSRIMSCMCNY